jgi:hypothetical protein
MTEFDRIKASPPPTGRERDPEGRDALFSVGEERPRRRARPHLACDRCGVHTPLDIGVVLRAAFPLFLVSPTRIGSVFAACPACRRRSWLHLTFHERV